MTQVTKKTWNLERVAVSLVDGELTVRGKNRGKSFEFKLPDTGISDKLGEPTTTVVEGVL